MTVKRPGPDAPLEEVVEWVKQYTGGVDPIDWPPPSPEQIEKLRRLFRFDTHPPGLT